MTTPKPCPFCGYNPGEARTQANTPIEHEQNLRDEDARTAIHAMLRALSILGGAARREDRKIDAAVVEDAVAEARRTLNGRH